MPDWVRHILGVLGITVPLTVLFISWKAWMELIALWSVVVFGGGGLLLAGVVESWWEERIGRIHSEQRELLIAGQLKDHDGKGK